MADYGGLSLSEIEDRIAIVRANIRELIEQSTGSEGAAVEDLNADRLAEQSEELKALEKERDARSR